MAQRRLKERFCLAPRAECNRPAPRRRKPVARVAAAAIAAFVHWSAALALDAGCPPAPAAPRAAVSEPVAYGEGLLWRITGDSGPPSHLFGTIHLDDTRVLDLPPAVRRALDASRRLVLEVDFDDQARRTFSDASRASDREYLQRSLAPAVFDALLEIAARSYRLRQADVVGLRPWALFTLLGRPPSSGLVLDEFLRDIAQRAGKDVFGLETAAELVASLDGMAPADQLDILVDAVCNHDRLPQQLERMVQYYLARDLAGMIAFNRSGHVDEALFQRLLERVLYERNLRMLDRIEGHLEHGGAFVAVGALHLPGERGLLAELEALGYQLERVY